MKVPLIWRIILAVFLWEIEVSAVYTRPPWELSLAHLREHWVEQLSAEGTNLNIKFRPPGGVVVVYRVNNDAEKWLSDEKGPEPHKLTIHVGDRLALIGRHARLYLASLPVPVSSYGFAVEEQVDGVDSPTVTNRVFMVLVGTNGIARGIGENGVVIVPTNVEAAKKVLANTGLTPASPTAEDRKPRALSLVNNMLGLPVAAWLVFLAVCVVSVALVIRLWMKRK